MTLRHSTGMRTFLLSTGFDTAFDTNGRLAFYSGASPTTGDASMVTGASLLATLTLSANAFSWATCSTCATAAAITSACATASGTPAFFVLYLTTETAPPASAVLTDKRVIGVVGATGTGSDITFDNTTWTASGTVAMTSFEWISPS